MPGLLAQLLVTATLVSLMYHTEEDLGLMLGLTVFVSQGVWMLYYWLVALLARADRSDLYSSQLR